MISYMIFWVLFHPSPHSTFYPVFCPVLTRLVSSHALLTGSVFPIIFVRLDLFFLLPIILGLPYTRPSSSNISFMHLDSCIRKIKFSNTIHQVNVQTIANQSESKLQTLNTIIVIKMKVTKLSYQCCWRGL